MYVGVCRERFDGHRVRSWRLTLLSRWTEEFVDQSWAHAAVSDQRISPCASTKPLNSADKTTRKPTHLNSWNLSDSGDQQMVHLYPNEKEYKTKLVNESPWPAVETAFYIHR